MQTFQEVLLAQAAALTAAHSQELETLRQEVSRLQAENLRLAEAVADGHSSNVQEAPEAPKEKLTKGLSCDSLESQTQTDALVAEAVRELEDGKKKSLIPAGSSNAQCGSDVESSKSPSPCVLSGPEESKQTAGTQVATHSIPLDAVKTVSRHCRRTSVHRGSINSLKIEKPLSRRFSRRQSSMSSLSTASFRLPGSSPPDKWDSECLSNRSSLNRFQSSDTPQEEGSDSDDSQATSFVVAFRLLDVWSASRAQRRAALVQGAGSLHSIVSCTFGTEDSDADDTQVLLWRGLAVNEKLKRFMVEPSSVTNLLWQACSLALIIKDVVAVPLEVFNISSSQSLVVLAWLSCGFWTLDIFHSFFTGYIKAQGAVETRFSQVARRYIQSWLFLDALCTMCDWVMLISWVSCNGTGFVNDVLKPASVLRVLRLMRLLKAPEIESGLAEHFRSEMTSVAVGIAKAVALLLGIAHVIACAWYSIGGHTSEGWVMQHSMAHATVFERYAWSLHWSLAQFVGESLFEIRSVSEHGFAICVLMSAFVFSALFVSSITTAMTRIQVLAGNESSQNRELHYFLADNHISTSLAVRVTRNAQHAVAERKKQAPESSIQLLQLVSEPLRAELHFEIRAPVLTAHPFFELYQEVNAVGVREVCHLAVMPIPVSLGDIIFSELETPVCPRMFFMTGDGSLQYSRELTSQDGSHHPCDCGAGSVKRGGWAGEPVLWTNWMHRGSLRAESNCVLLAVDAVRFQRIISPFPTQHAAIYGDAFVEHLNAASHQELTDLQSVDQHLCLGAAFPSNPRFSANADIFGGRLSNASSDSQFSARSSGRFSFRLTGSLDIVRNALNSKAAVGPTTEG